MRKLKVTELKRLSVEEYKQSEKLPLVVVLDNVRSLHNVGSVFRTSDAFRIAAVYLCGITACPPHAEIHKTALGAEDTVGWLYFERTADALAKLKGDGFVLCAVEQAEGSVELGELPVEKGKSYALVFGNEVKGVAQEVVDACDLCIEIPQQGVKHSLNVSVSAGIVLWHIFRCLSD
jgi:tRNA G18 (ribose-2'-O)-methylase SpoU